MVLANNLRVLKVYHTVTLPSRVESFEVVIMYTIRKYPTDNHDDPLAEKSSYRNHRARLPKISVYQTTELRNAPQEGFRLFLNMPV